MTGFQTRDENRRAGNRREGDRRAVAGDRRTHRERRHMMAPHNPERRSNADRRLSADRRDLADRRHGRDRRND